MFNAQENAWDAIDYGYIGPRLNTLVNKLLDYKWWWPCNLCFGLDENCLLCMLRVRYMTQAWPNAYFFRHTLMSRIQNLDLRRVRGPQKQERKNDCNSIFWGTKNKVSRNLIWEKLTMFNEVLKNLIFFPSTYQKSVFITLILSKF